MAISPNPLIPAGAMAAVDRVLGRLRTGTCVVQKRTTGRSPGGAPTSVYETDAAYACAVRPAGGTERFAGGRLAADADYELRLPRDAAVRGDDRILANGVPMEVVFVPSAADTATQLVVLAKAAS